MVGKTVSQYKILDHLGKGGMGEVYLAADLKLGRKVALKFLPAKLTANEDAQLRFKREAHAAAALNHPNIVTIHDINVHNEQVYIVMEYVKGRALKEKILDSSFQETTSSSDMQEEKTEILPGLEKRRGHPLQLEEIVDISLQVCEGLEKAHEAGIVHRDIKPQNIMIQDDGPIKILDFGLAKLRGTSQLTSEMTTVGTLHYMSPEQLNGDPLDNRTDIWSLGVVMFEMITGQQPFKGESQQSVMFSIINRPMPDIAKLNRKAPKKLIKIVKHCLVKSRDNRYQNISDLIVDLFALKDSGSIKRLSRGSSSRVKVNKSIPLKPKLMIPVLLLVTLLVLILLVPHEQNPLKKWLASPKLPEKKHIAVLSFVAQSKNSLDQLIANGFHKMINDQLQQIESMLNEYWVIPFVSIVEYNLKTTDDAKKRYNVNMVLVGELKRRNKELDLSLSVIDTDSLKTLKSVALLGQIGNLTIFQEGLQKKLLEIFDITPSAENQNKLNAGGTALPGAFEFYVKGQGYLTYHNNLEKIDQAIFCFQKALEQDPNFTKALIGKGESYWSKFDITSDKQWAQGAIESCNQAISQDGKNSKSYHLLGQIYKKLGDSDMAIANFEKTIQLNPGNFLAYAELYRIFNSKRELKKAEVILKRIRDIKPDYWPVYDHLGYFYMSKARWSESVSMYKKVIELTPKNMIGYRSLGAVYWLQEDWDNAAKMLKESVQIHPEYFSLMNLGTIYYFKGKYKESLSYYQSALKFNDEDYLIWGNLGDTYRQIPKYGNEALLAYKKAITKLNTLIKKTPNDALVRTSLALYLARSGNISGALKEIEKIDKLMKIDLDVWLNLVYIYEIAGKRELAFKFLKAYLDRHGSLEYITNEPDLKNLRNDPGFKKILDFK